MELREAGGETDKREINPCRRVSRGPEVVHMCMVSIQDLHARQTRPVFASLC